MSPEATPRPPEPSEAPRGGWVWDRRYSEASWPTEPDAAMVELVEPLAPGRALDLGCGTGRNAIWLARRGWDVTGVDASEVGLAQAQARATEIGVALNLVQDNLLDYRPPTARFDLVVVANIHLAPGERGPFFAAAASALAPGAHLFVVGHHLDSLGRSGPPDPERLFTEQRLAGLFPTLFVERLERFERHHEQGGSLIDVIVWATRTPSAPTGATT